MMCWFRYHDFHGEVRYGWHKSGQVMRCVWIVPGTQWGDT
jgi:hypothetical protein